MNNTKYINKLKTEVNAFNVVELIIYSTIFNRSIACLLPK